MHFNRAFLCFIINTYLKQDLKDNHRARRFYEKMGFTTLTKEKWYKEETLEYRLKRLL